MGELTSFRGSGKPPCHNGLQVKTRLIIVLLLAAISSPISLIIRLFLSSGCFSSTFNHVQFLPTLEKGRKNKSLMCTHLKLSSSVFQSQPHKPDSWSFIFAHTYLFAQVLCYVHSVWGAPNRLSKHVRSKVMEEEVMVSFFICRHVKAFIHYPGVGEPLEGLSLTL